MEHLLKRAASFPKWTQTPIPGFDISPAGLIALADLGTIAQRTRIAGGSSWLDALLLAPGLHYQQAADAVADGPASVQGGTAAFNVANPATLRYLRHVGHVGRADEKVVGDVGRMPQRSYFSFGSGRAAVDDDHPPSPVWEDQGVDFGWLSHVLYLASPVLTVAAIVFMVLLREWWGFGLLLALMLSRILNIWVIKQRSRPPAAPAAPPSPSPSRPSTPDLSNALAQYVVDLGGGRRVYLRGTRADLEAITATPWLAFKTHVEGYLEAMAKLTVFLVAAVSGNMTQAGSIVFLALLLVSAGLLGLSNAHAKAFRMHGRLAAPTTLHLPHDGDEYGNGKGKGKGTDGGGKVGDAQAHARTWPTADDESVRASSALGDLDDIAERGQAIPIARGSPTFLVAMEDRSTK
ncbi:hypothetical protein F4780DRAFT_566643 [Xylariomycetidae sp. FL0641]|nr:hypothetical protein F4780DRAFT_566643 [Xylariomycetidae sp. FL0641]